ncbi:hypothetical protein [Laribacter hongkongensis]|uniref:hypothetical protein n=1 Tax=Laribacter hongkongensis TaxID=168471 RepID=UPI001EFEC6BB|nr:hypothetical protein [Laribacter hongkongensis]MCG9083939.1 hypothetical protein [Laribacter hongkongensis]
MAKPENKPDAGVTFRDTAYKSRQIILDDGRVCHITGSSITTDDPALIAHLDRHGDFERVSEGLTWSA